MGLEDLVSIIMPVYNSQDYVGEAVESVRKQIYTNWELIIVDDGSTDNSMIICNQFQSIDNRICCIKIQHRGVSRARNVGINTAKGRYISFLDSDDLWDKNFLQNCMNYIKKNTDIKFIYSGSDELNENGKIINIQKNYKQGYFDVFIHKSGELRFPFNMDSFVVSLDLLNKYNIRFIEGYKISEDILFFLNILSVTPAYFVPKILTHYRRHSNSATTQLWSPERWESTVLLFQQEELFCKKYAPRLESALSVIKTYRTYRFVLQVLKTGDFDKTIYYIDKFYDDLYLFTKIGKKFNDRLKCRILLKKNKSLFSALAVI